MSNDELKSYQLKDDDYELVEDRAWFQCSKFSVRLGVISGGLFVDVYADGHEMEHPLASLTVDDSEADAVVRRALIEEAQYATGSDTDGA